jgi:hypothetical protein
LDTTNLTDHEKAMIAKANEAAGAPAAQVDAQITPAPAAADPAAPAAPAENQAERPEWCPEEFWNAETGAADTEALARKYAELAAPKPAETPAAPEGEPAVEATDPPFVAAVEAANADMLAEGKLKDETYAGFEKLGLSREHVDQYIEGQVAKAELTKMRVYAEVGGEDNLNTMIRWGIENYTETERQMFDQLMTSGDPEKALAASRSLAARYNAAEGKQGAVVTPQGQSHAAVTGYTSKDEVLADMAKPEYRKSAKFQAEVSAKIEAALKAGRDLGF